MNMLNKSKLIIFIILFPVFMLNGQQHNYKFRDTSLSFDERADDLLSRLTLAEKVGLMQDVSMPVERLGIKEYNWWNEALHGVARAGLATVFPQPIGLAATFSETSVHRVFSAVSDEARAKYAQFVSKGEYGRYQGLTMWTPNINIFRDPRWGRGIETYGEDPYLTSRMGIAVVTGLQGPDTGRYDKIHACAKHFAVHSGPEWNRHSYNAENISDRDLHETYLPAFRALVQEAGVKEVMCAYNRLEGEPCCGNKWLLTDILRKKWGFEGIVVSDCGAIADFYKPGTHLTHTSAATASSAAVKSGTDLECGTAYSTLIDGLNAGYISEKEIDVSVRRLLKARFELGEMDKPENNPWNQISYSVVASAEHDKLALEAARESMTLLLNKNNILPLKTGGLTVAVMGPNADDPIMQWGNYNGIPPHTVTILDGIRAALTSDDKLIYEPCCGLVERTLMKSAFGQCASADGPGFSATYWNSPTPEGEPAVKNQIYTPFRFDTSGATVFAPGVNLTGFSATYHSVFTPEKSGEVFFDFYVNGILSLYVDNTEVKNLTTSHGSRQSAYSMQVVAGRPYEIKINFRPHKGNAQLNFDMGFREMIHIEKSVDAVKKADVVIFAGGISPSLEGEEMGVNLPGFRRGDRTDIELPEVQRELIAALHKAGKKVIFINCSGSPIAMVPETENCEAILQAWYPGQAGGTAVADVIFGHYNPAGRLPVTFYKSINQLPDFEDYNMKGRTYRYMTEEPLFPFGYGLSYTTFSYGKARISKTRIKSGKEIRFYIPVTNTGKMDGDEVVQVYLRNVNDKTGPRLALRDFKRVHIPAGETRNVHFQLSGNQLSWWNENTREMDIHSAVFEIFAGPDSGINNLKKIGTVHQK